MVKLKGRLQVFVVVVVSGLVLSVISGLILGRKAVVTSGSITICSQSNSSGLPSRVSQAEGREEKQQRGGVLGTQFSPRCCLVQSKPYKTENLNDFRLLVGAHPRWLPAPEGA